MTSLIPSTRVLIIGAGPAGLMAAETLSSNGIKVTIYDRMKSPGRKFLLAGRGGLNLTHSERQEKFIKRYGPAASEIQKWLDLFSPADLRAWAEGLGEPTFTGSSGRIFPKSFKASPLLRAWLHRLETQGVEFKLQRQWTGWDNNRNFCFAGPDHTPEIVKADVAILALGGASWPKLGSDGAWYDILKEKNITLSPLRPSNCGFHVSWSDVFRDKFSGQPIKTIALTFEGQTIHGEIMIDRNGIEGGAVYALSRALRSALEEGREAILTVDLRPALDMQTLIGKLSGPQKRQSFSSWLQRVLDLPPVAINLLREADRNVSNYSAKELAARMKAVPVKVQAPFSIERAISSAGGIKLDALDKRLMIKAMPGIFAAGEMLDWEAPTGGYLLQASLSSGQQAAQGVLNYFKRA